jgi:hypothetical protein
MNGDGKVDDIVSVQRRYVIDQLSGCWRDPNRVCLRTRQLFEQDLLPVPQGGCHLSRLVQKDFQLVTTEVLLSEHVYASLVTNERVVAGRCRSSRLSLSLVEGK